MAPPTGRHRDVSVSLEAAPVDYENLLSQVIVLIRAVSICMFSVAAMVHVLRSSRNPNFQLLYVRYPDEEWREEPVVLMNSFANAFGFLAAIMIISTAMVLLYKAGFYKFIKAWLMMGSAVHLFFAGYYYSGRVLIFFNAPVDHFTCALITWNVGIVGITALYCDAPVLVRQGYLIYVSILISLMLVEFFPEWTSWILLVMVSMWDVFAVLCVLGPLRLLLETAKERNEPLFPALVFSTSSAWFYDVASTASERCQETASLSNDDPTARKTAFSLGRSQFTEYAAGRLRLGSERSTLESAYFVTDFAASSPSPPQKENQGGVQTPVTANYDQCPIVQTDHGRSLAHCANISVTDFTPASSTFPDVPERSPIMLPQGAVTRCPNDGSKPGSSKAGCPPQGSDATRSREMSFLTQSSNSEDSLENTVDGDNGRSAADLPTPSHSPGLSGKRGANKHGRSNHRGGSPALRQHQEAAPGERGMMMGLGDFIFYSLLLGKASLHGTVATVLACYVSVIVGIFLTLTLLVVFRQPLPALPLSITLGLLAYASGVTLFLPFLDAIDFRSY